MAAGSRSPADSSPQCVSPLQSPTAYGQRRLSVRMSLGKEVPSRREREDIPRLLSLGGREGPGQRINGDYEIVDGLRPNGRPCWMRRGKPMAGHGADGLVEHHGDERPLYLFFGEMGYWSVAASVHAAGVHVLARSGPDFSSATPDACPMTWTVFAFGKAHRDAHVVCFRHDPASKVPEELHVAGCKGDHGQLNGTYVHVPGVQMGSRAVFLKDGTGIRGSLDERKVLHFSQRSGRWLISSAVFGNSFHDQLSTNSTVMQAAVQQDWHSSTILAKSPLAWTSLSPANLPREPWSILKNLPTRLQFGVTERRRRVDMLMESSGGEFDGDSEEVAYIPCQGLQVGLGPHQAVGHRLSRSFSPASRASSCSLAMSAQGGSDTFSPRTPRGQGQELDLLLCVHLRSHDGISDSFGLNGDYVWSDQVYGDRSVFVKVTLRPRVSGQEPDDKDRQLFLFFDDTCRRWQVAPEVGAKGFTILARSPAGWDEVPTDPSALPAGVAHVCSADLGPWQVRVPELGVHLPIGRKGKRTTTVPEASPAFRDCAELEVLAFHDRRPPRTVAFFYQNGEDDDAKDGPVTQAFNGHPLEGDFRLLRQRYGHRPVYRRAPLKHVGPGPGLASQPALFLFFEPRSGLWAVTTISPLASSHAHASARPDVPGRFGQVLARSGPSWAPLLAEDTKRWDAADSQVPGHHLRHGPARAPPSRLLSEQLSPTPWLQLRALGTEAPPTFLCIGGFENRLWTLNGSYELLPETMWGSRPAWKRLPLKPEIDFGGDSADFPKFMYFWSETGHWIIGPDLHFAPSGLARNGPGRWAAQSPDHCPGRWEMLNGQAFEEDNKIYCRRQHAAYGCVDAFGLSSASSPRKSLGPRKQQATPWTPTASRRRSSVQDCGEMPSSSPVCSEDAGGEKLPSNPGSQKISQSAESRNRDSTGTARGHDSSCVDTGQQGRKSLALGSEASQRQGTNLSRDVSPGRALSPRRSLSPQRDHDRSPIRWRP
eukprot:TRINITY_DN31704_c0_g1_i2.p1 TRINITY_DN31704_c0_g1~~TRINITY_DN31704_c0_g1_i2.p1  ORF type:complete len:992 (+),score=108.93 TRINITY_DN31704_c0_g1_i2:66-3041(+)